MQPIYRPARWDLQNQRWIYSVFLNAAHRAASEAMYSYNFVDSPRERFQKTCCMNVLRRPQDTAGILGLRFFIPTHYDLLELFTGVDDVIFWRVLTLNSVSHQNLMQNASLSDHGIMLAMVQDDSITLPMICILYTCFISHIFTQTQKYTHANTIPSCLVIDIIGWMI